MRIGAPAVALLTWALVGVPLAAHADAWVDYALHCMGCHRADGSGTGDEIPPLAGTVGSFLRAPGGREYLVRVPGVAQAPLDDAALARLLNWMLREFSPNEVPADFVPYAPEEVGRLRADPLVDVETVRAELIEQIRAGR